MDTGMIKVVRLVLLMCVAVLASCQPDEPKQPVSIAPAEKKDAVPASPVFNADSAFSYVKSQVDFGPRAMNTKNHEACGVWLIEKLKQFADTVYIQKGDVKGWDGKTLKATNIIASFLPKNSQRILIASHWDARPWADQDSIRPNDPVDAANDGASGVGIIIEMARLMKLNAPPIGVDLILLDAEDYGQPEDKKPYVPDSWCLGTQLWAKNPHVPGYYANYGILLDMVGAKDAVFAQERNSVQFARNIVEKVWNKATGLGYGRYFTFDSSGPITDDHVYINSIAHIPCIDIIQHDPNSPSQTFYKYWHTHNDKIDFIDRNTLKAVGQTLLETIYNDK